MHTKTVSVKREIKRKREGLLQHMLARPPVDGVHAQTRDYKQVISYNITPYSPIVTSPHLSTTALVSAMEAAIGIGEIEPTEAGSAGSSCSSSIHIQAGSPNTATLPRNLVLTDATVMTSQTYKANFTAFHMIGKTLQRILQACS